MNPNAVFTNGKNRVVLYLGTNAGCYWSITYQDLGGKPIQVDLKKVPVWGCDDMEQAVRDIMASGYTYIGYNDTPNMTDFRTVTLNPYQW